MSSIRTPEGVREGVTGLLADVPRLPSKGATREKAYVAIQRAEWEGPFEVKAFLKEAAQAISAAWKPIADPDRLLLLQRQAIEEEIDRRYGSGNLQLPILSPSSWGRNVTEIRWSPRSRSDIREEVLREMEQGGAPGLGSLAVQTFAKAADTLFGRPVRAAVLAARDRLWGSPSTRSAWERAEEFGALTQELVEGVQDAPVLQGYARVVGMTTEFLGDLGVVLGAPGAIRALATAAKGSKAATLLSRVGAFVSDHGGEAAASSLSRSSLAARERLRGLMQWMGKRELPLHVEQTLGVRIKRAFATATVKHPGVSESPTFDLLERIPGMSKLDWQQHHIFIQKRWFALGRKGAETPSLWYGVSEKAARLGLQRLGNAGWNLVPIPGRLNAWLYRTPGATEAFAALAAGSVPAAAYGGYKLGEQAADQVFGIGNGE